ncbi:MAG TPA: tripartite tricarboxylate transporter permease [Candidatus Acidoferrales bacterium]|nr:tripartite tricarboxylate transporter permease [Candidatus Acidoferrales bacterium]
MDSLSNLFLGFGIALTLYNVLIASVGVFLGIIIGILPGLGGTSGVAILLPLTFVMAPTSAIIFLTSIYWGALFGGVITSILFNIPGEPWSVAATFDGYPMAKQGRAGYALSLAFIGGFFASLVSIILFSFFAPPLAELALQFGPPEYFAVMLLAFSTFVGLGGGSAIKNLTAALIGFLLASVGLDIVTGTPRLTFDSIALLSGFNFVTVCIGLFGIGEILISAEEALEFKGQQGKIGIKDVVLTIADTFRSWVTWLTGTLLGFWVGVLPGTGATPASFMAYGMARQYSRQPEKFGTGITEGLLSTQSAAQAAGIGSLLPLVTLGVPGSPTAAVMLGGLYIWGLQPGPLLFIEKPDFVWGLMASMYVGNVIGLLMCLLLVPFFTMILRIPYAILAPVIVLISSVGAYAVNNRLVDVWLMLLFGVVGYVFKKIQIPLAPLVIALVLGDMTETALRQSFIMSHGSLAIFFTRPISAACTTIAIMLFIFPTLRLMVPWMRERLWVPQGGG